jgi:hypothetical protein
MRMSPAATVAVLAIHLLLIGPCSFGLLTMWSTGVGRGTSQSLATTIVPQERREG